MTSSISGIPYAASKGGTRDAADQEITDRVNTANKLNGKSDRAIEITESNATGDRNPDGQLPWDQFARSNQHADHSLNEKDILVKIMRKTAAGVNTDSGAESKGTDPE